MKRDSKSADALAWRNEGDACAARADLDAALHCFECAHALDPSCAVSLARLAATLAALRRFPEAVGRYEEAVALDPHDADLHHGLGWTFEQMHRPECAARAYREAVGINPAADGSQNNLGNCLLSLGLFDEARQAYRRAIDAAPRVPLYYRNAVQSGRLTASDPFFIAMEKLVADAASLTPADQAEIHFAYGAALADMGRNETSFDHFLKGNALHRATVRYDEAETLGLFARLPELFSADVLAAKRDLGDPTSSPVFIVGMPRSGSTLIEQILASHPHVFGTGERTEFSEALVHSIHREQDDAQRIDIEAIGNANAAQLNALGVDYLRRIRDAVPKLQSDTWQRIWRKPSQEAWRIAQQAAQQAAQQTTQQTAQRTARQQASDDPDASSLRFTDKYPFNFINIGLIHLALPNARFIHSTRSPLQTCLSIFSRIFQDVPFGYDLGELGRYYRAYDALMAHWQRVLPEGVMIEVRYEELVEDLEGNVRRLLAHCGLDWDARCLSFHETAREVGTASAAQVRRPLYRTSVRRWLPDEALLAPLIDGLGSDLTAQALPRDDASIRS